MYCTMGQYFMVTLLELNWGSGVTGAVVELVLHHKMYPGFVKDIHTSSTSNQGLT